MSKLGKIILLIISVLISFYFCFWNLSSEPLEKWDESIYLNVIEKSLDDNSYTLPRIDSSSNPEFSFMARNDGYFFEKPPLWFWIGYVFYNFSPDKIFTLRLVSAVSGFILIMLSMWLCYKKWGFGSSILVPIVFVTTNYLFQSNLENIFSTHHFKSINLDILQLVFIFISQLLLFNYYETKRNNMLKLAGLFIGLGILTKGFVSLLPLAIFASALYLIGKYKIKDIAKLLSQVVIVVLIIILPWYLYAYYIGGWGFVDNHFLYHNVYRAATVIEDHREPWSFYLENILNPELFLFGSVFLIGLIYFLLKSKDFYYFNISVYVLAILIVFTLVQTKLSWYTLYIFPFAAIIPSVFIVRLISKIKELYSST